MANNIQQVKFLTGSQENLNKLTTSDKGAFYLTNDTYRLYTGMGEGQKPALLNKVVAVVNAVKDLPSATSSPAVQIDDFYYVKTGNMLCVYTGPETGVNGWTQINVDTIDTVIEVASMEIKLDEENSDETHLEYTVTLKQKKYNPNIMNDAGTDLEDVTTSFSIDGSVLQGIIPEAASVGLKTTVNANKAVINTTGAGANEASAINITGSGATSVSSDANGNITISSVAGGLDATNSKFNDTTYELQIKDTFATTATFDLSKLKTDAVSAANAYTDQQIQAVSQALIYKGVVESPTDLLAKEIVNGHMYKAGGTASTSIIINSQSVPFEPGDVFIGYNNTWERIPSGDDVEDTRYKGQVTIGADNKSISYGIIEDILNNTTVVGDAFLLNFGDGIVFDSNTKTITTSLTTADSTDTTALSADGSFTIYNPVLTNDKITSFKKHTYTLPADKNTTYSLQRKDNTVILVSSDVINDETNTITLQAKDENSPISITAANTDNKITYTFDLVWGSF